MPSPIGHSIAGLALSELFGDDGAEAYEAVFWANAPDVDMLMGLLEKDPAAWHGYRSHSVGAAIVAGAASGLEAWWRGRRPAPAFWQASAAYASHLALDFLGKQQEDGMPILWPFAHRRWASPNAWFGTITSSGKAGRRFFTGLLSMENVISVSWEVVSLLPFWLAARHYRAQRARRSSGGRCAKKKRLLPLDRSL